MSKLHRSYLIPEQFVDDLEFASHMTGYPKSAIVTAAIANYTELLMAHLDRAYSE